MKFRVTEGSNWSRPKHLELTKEELIFPSARYKLADIDSLKFKGTRSKPFLILHAVFITVFTLSYFIWVLTALAYFLAIPYLTALAESAQLNVKVPTQLEVDKFWLDLHTSSNPLFSYAAHWEKPLTQLLAMAVAVYLVPYVISPIIARKRIAIKMRSGEEVQTDCMIAPHPIIFVYNLGPVRLPYWIKRRAKKAYKNQVKASAQSAGLR